MPLGSLTMDAAGRSFLGWVAMTVRIVERVPAHGAGRTVVRFVAVTLGVLLVSAGLVMAVVPLLAVVVFADSLRTGSQMSMSGQGWQQLLIFTALAGAAVWLGLRLIRGRRRIGLYLRKFGFAPTTNTVSFALRRAAGRTWRLVTLDDSMVVPVGVGTAKRGLSTLAVLVGVGLAGWVVWYFISGDAAAQEQRNLDNALAQADSAGDRLAQTVGIAFINALGTLMLIIFGCLFALIMIAGFAARRAASRAEGIARQSVHREHEIGAAAGRLAAAARRTFAPRLMVVSVPTSFWQRAIHGLAQVCDVVVIDVSEPTDALLWEVQHIKPMFAGRWVLVGARERVAALAHPQTALTGSPQGLLARLLDGEEILAYGHTVLDRQVFAESLRHRLSAVGRR